MRKICFFTAMVLFAGLCGFRVSAQSIVEVPFEFHRNRVVIKVYVNHKGPYNMLLDTGTSPSAIDREAAKEMGLKLSQVNVGGKGTGSDPIISYQTNLSEVQIGGLKARNIHAVAVEGLSNIGKQLGKKIDGVLGYSLLKGRVVQNDYRNSVIRFYPRSRVSTESLPTNRRSVHAFRLLDDTPIIEKVCVNGKEITATLDTGSNGFIRLTSKTTEALGLKDAAQNSDPVGVTGFAGSARYRKGSLKTLALGSLVVDSPEVLYVMEKKAGSDLEADGNIGNAFMSRFLVTFDYIKKIVIFDAI